MVVDDRNVVGEFKTACDEAFQDLKPPELEHLVVAAILEHRFLLSKADFADREWGMAKDAQEVDHTVVAKLKRDRSRAQAVHRAHQLVLNEMLERLGYIPDVPTVGDDEADSAT